VLTTTAPGTVTISAIVKDGKAPGEDYYFREIVGVDEYDSIIYADEDGFTMVITP
jgi:hypothetical protein